MFKIKQVQGLSRQMHMKESKADNKEQLIMQAADLYDLHASSH